MRLYIGGAYQGQAELARQENPGAETIGDFHEIIRRVMAEGGDPRAYAMALCREKPEAVVVSNEVGSGVVPMAAEKRAWREGVGRALCVIAQAAESVTRVVCGIGVHIK